MTIVAKRQLDSDLPAKSKRHKTEPVKPETKKADEKLVIAALNDEEKELLKKIHDRLKSRNNRMLMIRPVPNHCPISLLLDLCPTAYAVQFPNLKSAKFAFLIFRNEKQLLAAESKLSELKLNEKDIKTKRALDKFDMDKMSLERFDLKTLQVLDLPEGTTKFDLGKLFPNAIDIEMRVMSDGKICSSCQLKYKTKEDAIADFTSQESANIREIPIYLNFVIKPLHKSKKSKRSTSETKAELEKMVTSDEEEEQDSDDDEELPRKVNKAKQSMDVDEEEETGKKNKKKNSGKKLQQSYQKRPKGTTENSVKIKKTKFKKK